MNIRDKIEKLEKELVELKKSINVFPQMGDDYYYICSTGAITQLIWADNYLDRCRASIGNVFETKKEANMMVEKLNLLAEIKRWCKNNDPEGFKLDWTDDYQKKYYLFYNYSGNKWDWSTAYDIQYISAPYFSGDEKAQAFINNFGDRLNLLLDGGN